MDERFILSTIIIIGSLLLFILPIVILLALYLDINLKIPKWSIVYSINLIIGWNDNDIHKFNQKNKPIEVTKILKKVSPFAYAKAAYYCMFGLFLLYFAFSKWDRFIINVLISFCLLWIPIGIIKVKMPKF